MTQELKIEQVCTHLVVDEVTSLESDLRTLRTLRPFANSQVELKINGYLVEEVTNPIYGFSLIRDVTSLDPTARILQFRSLRRSTNEFYEVTYYTKSSECRRCHGLRIEQDYKYTIHGKLLMVVNEKKLGQELRKLVLTSIGSNQFHTWYGTSISNLIGSKITNTSFLTSKIESDLRTAIRRYSDTQNKQMRALASFPNAQVDPREMFGRLLKLEVQRDTLEPTSVNVQISCTNRAADLIIVSTKVALPDPVSLVYNTVQEGGQDPRFQSTR